MFLNLVLNIDSLSGGYNNLQLTEEYYEHTDFKLILLRFWKRSLKAQNIMCFLLRHPNILRFYNYFHDRKRVFLVLEYAPRGEMYKELQRCGRFDDQRTATVRVVAAFKAKLFICKYWRVIFKYSVSCF